MRDLIIKYKNNILKFKFLEWDTKFFGKSSYILDTGNTNIMNDTLSLRKYILRNLPNNSFITARIPNSTAHNPIDLFLYLGFKYIDTSVMLYIEKDKINNYKVPFNNLNSEVKIFKLDINCRLPYYALGTTFYLTRFHRDTNIGVDKASQLWIEYVKNFTPDSHKHIFVAKLNKKISGIILLKEEEKTAEICFVSVVKDFQNKGIGSILIKEVIEWVLKRNSVIVAGTQSVNVNALNFYIKNGFLIKESHIAMHRWS